MNPPLPSSPIPNYYNQDVSQFSPITRVYAIGGFDHSSILSPSRNFSLSPSTNTNLNEQEPSPNLLKTRRALTFDSNDQEQPPAKKQKVSQCNCKNSKCLKLYCECFANQLYCTSSCNCKNCANLESNESVVVEAIKSTLERNPAAFKPKISKNATSYSQKSNPAARHAKGCHCKKSGCLKKYCECFQAGIPCGELCRCIGCKNRGENPAMQNTTSHCHDHSHDHSHGNVHYISDEPAVPPEIFQDSLMSLTKVMLLTARDIQSSSQEMDQDLYVKQEAAVLTEVNKFIQKIVERTNS